MCWCYIGPIWVLVPSAWCTLIIELNCIELNIATLFIMFPKVNGYLSLALLMLLTCLSLGINVCTIYYAPVMCVFFWNAMMIKHVKHGYQLMLSCWHTEPQAHLSFTQLKYSFKSIVAEQPRYHRHQHHSSASQQLCLCSTQWFSLWQCSESEGIQWCPLHEAPNWYVY